MGGTSADVGLIIDGEQSHTTEYEIEWGVPAAIPLIDIKSIGAGGGSIAWIDAGDFLRVGPQSAGAAPGPACYGRGGTRPTVTDANLLLGRLDPGLLPGRTDDPRCGGWPPGAAASRRSGADDARRPGIVDCRDRQREHGQRDQDGVDRAGARSPAIHPVRVWWGRATACRRGGELAAHSAGADSDLSRATPRRWAC